MKSNEVIKKLQQINNATADIKISIDDILYDIGDIEWSGIENGNNIIIKGERLEINCWHDWKDDNCKEKVIIKNRCNYLDTWIDQIDNKSKSLCNNNMNCDKCKYKVMYSI